MSIIPRRSILCAVFLTIAAAGCASDFEVVPRGDGTNARLLRRMDLVWPLFAESFRFNLEAFLDLKAAMLDAGTAVGLERNVELLFDNADQLNFELRSHLVGMYLVHQDAQMETDPNTRQRARDRWAAFQEKLLEHSRTLRRTVIKCDELLAASKAGTPLDEPRIDEMAQDIRSIRSSLATP